MPVTSGVCLHCLALSGLCPELRCASSLLVGPVPLSSVSHRCLKARMVSSQPGGCHQGACFIPFGLSGKWGVSPLPAAFVFGHGDGLAW